MRKEYNGVIGYKVQLKDNEKIFIRSNIRYETLDLSLLEWIKLGNVNFQGRGILTIETYEETPFQIVFKSNQYNEIKQLYDILLPYTKRIKISDDESKMTIFNKGNPYKIINNKRTLRYFQPHTYLSLYDINSYEIIIDNQIHNKDTLTTIFSNDNDSDYDWENNTAILSLLNFNEYITNLQIKLNMNNFDNPCVYVNYITRKIKSDSQMAKDLIKMCDEDLAKLEIILKKDKPVEKKVSNDPIEEVKKLKGLLDMGILSQEEFDKKKKELLNL